MEAIQIAREFRSPVPSVSGEELVQLEANPRGNTITKIWINTLTNWGQDGAIFDDFNLARATAKNLAEEHGCDFNDLLCSLEEIDVETADAFAIKEAVARALIHSAKLSATTLKAIAERFDDSPRRHSNGRFGELPVLDKQLEYELGGMEGKYFDLVWYARSDRDCCPGREDGFCSTVCMAQSRIEATYPNETDGLNFENGEDGQWHHGFNSGMLACTRFIWTALCDGDLEEAKEEFPMLDT